MRAGFAAAHACWLPQLDALLKPVRAGDLPPVRIMVLDNRGVGRSSAPDKMAAYSTSIMADDVLAVMVRALLLPRATHRQYASLLCRACCMLICLSNVASAVGALSHI